MGKPIMIVGTASGAGKSLICTALCRILTNRGYSVAPFKMQNMSLNAICSYEGLEMSIAQYIQALACKKKPSVVYNPLLLKPENGQTYVVFEGKFSEIIPAASYMTNRKQKYFKKGLQTLQKLMDENDYVIIEGAGSPAEVNLMPYDITNMAVAKAVNADTFIVTDIDRGGSFASIVGTMEIFNPHEKKLIKGFIFNKFRGIAEMLTTGFDYLREKYNIHYFSVIPMLTHALPEEDSLQNWETKRGDLDICVIRTPFISNFSDFSPLSWYNGVRYVQTPGEVHGDLIILPGSKRTVDDLKWLRMTQIDKAIYQAWKKGTFIMGLCGGFQMMGTTILDNFETLSGKVEGLGILPITTVINREKRKGNVNRKITLGSETYFVKGYEIRHGETSVQLDNPFSEPLPGEKGFSDCCTENACGTYLHGLFYNDDFTIAFLNRFRHQKGLLPITSKMNSLDQEIEQFACAVEKHLNVDAIVYGEA
ncbi:MAG: cobyric acid synthase [Thermotogota bacterium]|nr:cobyric acid synthase [Thermotogota bacterium]